MSGELMPTRFLFIRDRKDKKVRIVRVEFDRSKGPPAWSTPKEPTKPKDTSPPVKN